MFCLNHVLNKRNCFEFVVRPTSTSLMILNVKMSTLWEDISQSILKYEWHGGGGRGRLLFGQIQALSEHIKLDADVLGTFWNCIIRYNEMYFLPAIVMTFVQLRQSESSTSSREHEDSLARPEVPRSLLSPSVFFSHLLEEVIKT